MSGARATLAMLAGIAGGLALAGSTTAEWFALSGERDVGGVPVPDDRGVAGGEVAAELLPLGLAAAAVALVLAVGRGWVRRLAGAVLLLLAVASLWPVARPLATGVRGDPAAGIAVAVAGAVLVAGAGVLALRSQPPPGLSARYDLDVDDADDEWRLASAEEDGDGEWDPASVEDGRRPQRTEDDER